MAVCVWGTAYAPIITCLQLCLKQHNLGMYPYWRRLLVWRHYRKTVLMQTKALIPVERCWLKDELEKLGFWACASKANYLLFCGKPGLHKELKNTESPFETVIIITD